MNIVQVAQHAEDLDRAAQFYTYLTGSGPTGRFEPPGLLFFDLGGVRLLLEKGAPPATVYLKIDSVRERIEQLRADGVPIEAEPHVIFTHADDLLGPAGMVEWHGFIRDSEGNLVGLVSLEPPDLANVEETVS